MEFLPIIILTIFLLAIAATLLFRKNVGLKQEIAQLKKEVEIQDSRLTYQKEQFSDSASYFYSAVVIITNMMQELNYVLKKEEEDTLEKILQIIFENAKNLFRPQNCAVFKVDGQKKTFSCLYNFGYREKELEALGPVLDANTSFLGWSAQSGRFLSFQDAEHDSILSHLNQTDPLKCQYSLPLKVDTKVEAVLCVGRLLELIEEDVAVQLFSILSNIASVTLSDAVLAQELRNLSVRDSLTGLYNHSYFQKWLENALDSLKEEGEVLCLIMADLDFFKRVNDTYGHQAGDVVLKGVSSLLNSLDMSEYICARYGGEEFVLVFKGRDIFETLAVAEDLREKIAQKKFEIDKENIQITISMGVAETKLQAGKKFRNPELIEAADKALYRAKAEGRNRVIRAE
jgi:diguanylate cyclase (GGDEF)-like protein